jgi:hypothetical protein
VLPRLWRMSTHPAGYSLDAERRKIARLGLGDFEGRRPNFIVMPESPRALRNATETLVYYFRREFCYDFVQYEADEHKHAKEDVSRGRSFLFTPESGGSAHTPIAGAACFRWPKTKTYRPVLPWRGHGCIPTSGARESWRAVGPISVGASANFTSKPPLARHGGVLREAWIPESIAGGATSTGSSRNCPFLKQEPFVAWRQKRDIICLYEPSTASFPHFRHRGFGHVHSYSARAAWLGWVLVGRPRCPMA